MLRKIFNPPTLPLAANWGVLILRVGTSLLMLTHGYGKLERFLTGERGFADPIGIGEELSFVLAIFAEFICSVLLIAGLFTRAVLVPLIITMLVAFLIIHSDDPFDKQEHPLLFLIPYITLLLTGPGQYSLDQRLFK
jgi:putative oxidoreductase